MSPIPELSVITVNYNGIRDTRELIESLQAHLPAGDYELIVVDNGSRQNEASILQQEYPHIKTIRSEKNLGFAGGNNLGLQEARGEYLLLINNDTYVTDNSLFALCRTLKNNPTIGAVGPKIRFSDPPQLIQFAGFTPFSKYTLRNRGIGTGEPDQGQYDTPPPTPIHHGAAKMLKREVIDKVGKMPEIYFLYYEEMDWCSRISRAGYRLWYEPSCTVYHKESRTTGRFSPLKTYYLTRNRLLYTWRNRQGISRYIALLYQFCLANPKNILINLLQGNLSQIKAVFKGSINFLLLKNKQL